MKLTLLLAFILLLPAMALADSSALILTGVAGSPEHAEKFTKWTEGTRKALVDKFGFSADRVIVLSDKKTAQAEIKAAFVTLKQQLNGRYLLPFLYRSRQWGRRVQVQHQRPGFYG